MPLNFHNSILIDLDNTITISDYDKEYSQLDFDKEILDSIEIAKNKGYQIKIHTSRNMRTFNGDIEKINSVTLPIIKEWLKKKGIPYDDILVGKPWGGPKGIYVDDKSLSPFEFKLRTFSSTLFESISIVSSFYNESQNIKRLWNQLIEVDKYLNINQFIFADNGSTDNTFEKLNNLTKNDKRVIVIQNQKPSSYSNGMSSCLQKIDSEYTLILHSDCQINIDLVIKTWLEEIYSRRKNSDLLLSRKKVLTSYRLNRDFKSNLLTYTNNFLTYLLLKWPVLIDFNSQPKIVHTSILKGFYIKTGFLFDISLVNHLFKKFKEDKSIYFFKPVPVIVKERFEGKSSWNGNFLKTLKIIKSYLIFIFKESLFNK